MHLANSICLCRSRGNCTTALVNMRLDAMLTKWLSHTLHCSCCFLWGVLAEASQLSWLCGADVLLKLVQERGFEMFVHPIAPVLNETRHVVAPFNHKLQQQVHMPLLNTDCETCQCPVMPLCLRPPLSKTASMSVSSRM